jgi:Uncharacterized conserved protein
LLAIDPVCGMSVDEKSSKYSSQYRGKTYYFCSRACKDRFDNNPERYAAGER